MSAPLWLRSPVVTRRKAEANPNFGRPARLNLQRRPGDGRGASSASSDGPPARQAAPDPAQPGAALQPIVTTVRPRISPLRIFRPASITHTIPFDEVFDAGRKILKGEIRGRTVVTIG